MAGEEQNKEGVETNTGLGTTVYFGSRAASYEIKVYTEAVSEKRKKYCKTPWWMPYVFNIMHKYVRIKNIQLPCACSVRSRLVYTRNIERNFITLPPLGTVEKSNGTCTLPRIGITKDFDNVETLRILQPPTSENL